MTSPLDLMAKISSPSCATIAPTSEPRSSLASRIALTPRIPRPLGVHSVDRRALGETTVGDGDHEGVLADDVHGEQLVAAAELHADHTLSGTSHGTQCGVIGVETHGLTLARHEQQVVVGAAEDGRDDLVALAQVDRDDAAAAVGVVLGQPGLLDHAAAGGQHEVRRTARSP